MTYMAQPKMHQVAVRMTEAQHFAALKMAKRRKLSFGEFVRRAVADSLAQGVRLNAAAGKPNDVA